MRQSRSCPGLHLVEGVGLEPMCLAMDTGRRLLVRGADEAEDLALGLVDPVLLVVDAVLALDGEISLMGPRHVFRLHAGDVMHIHVRGHGVLLEEMDRWGFLTHGTRRRYRSPTRPCIEGRGARRTGGPTRSSPMEPRISRRRCPRQDPAAASPCRDRRAAARS